MAVNIKYHKNAKTDIRIRKFIQKSKLTIDELALKFGINKNTVLKWKHRDDALDKSCAPLNTRKKLNINEEIKICGYRKKNMAGIDTITDALINEIPHINRYLVYRCLKKNNIM